MGESRSTTEYDAWCSMQGGKCGSEGFGGGGAIGRCWEAVGVVGIVVWFNRLCVVRVWLNMASQFKLGGRSC